MSTGRARKASVGAIFLTVFLDLLGFGLVLPFLADEARVAFHTDPFVATLLASVYSLMQFLFVPVWGRLSDRIGRRPVLVWSIAATAVGMVGLGLSLTFASSVFWLFVTRIFSGIATANIGTASAYIADVTTPEDRAKGMGMIGMAFGLGFIFGPGLGGLLAETTILGRHGALPCFVAAGLSVVNLVWVLFGLGESLPPEKRTQPGEQAKRRLTPMDVAATARTLRTPAIGMAILVNFIIVLSFTNLDQTFRFFTKDLFAMDMKATGMTLALVGVVAAFTQGGLIRPLSKRVSDRSLIRVGVFLQIIAFTGLALSPRYGRGCLYAASAILAVGNGFTQASTSAYASRRASAKEQGATLGVYQSFSSLARMFGPAFGGLLYELTPTAPYVSAAIGMGIAFAVSLLLPGATGSPIGAGPAGSEAPLDTTTPLAEEAP